MRCFAVTEAGATVASTTRGGLSLRAFSSEACRPPLHPTAEDFFARAVGTLAASGLPFLLGGGYAMREYTGMSRRTKDLDIFVRPSHAAPILEVFAQAGFVTEMTDPVWLAKIFCNAH